MSLARYSIEICLSIGDLANSVSQSLTTLLASCMQWQRTALSGKPYSLSVTEFSSVGQKVFDPLCICVNCTSYNFGVSDHQSMTAIAPRMMPDHLAEEGAPARETLDALLTVVQSADLVRKLKLIDCRHGGGSL